MGLCPDTGKALPLRAFPRARLSQSLRAVKRMVNKRTK